MRNPISGSHQLFPVVEYPKVRMNVNKMDISFPNQVYHYCNQTTSWLLLVHLYKSGSNHHIYHYQLFIDGLFCDATSGKKLRSIDPRNEELICEVTLFRSLSFEHFCHFFCKYDLKVESASSEDVDRACKAAQRAFEGNLPLLCSNLAFYLIFLWPSPCPAVILSFSSSFFDQVHVLL